MIFPALWKLPGKFQGIFFRIHWINLLVYLNLWLDCVVKHSNKLNGRSEGVAFRRSETLQEIYDNAIFDDTFDCSVKKIHYVFLKDFHKKAQSKTPVFQFIRVTYFLCLFQAGYLHKRTADSNKWQMRWFVLYQVSPFILVNLII